MNVNRIMGEALTEAQIESLLAGKKILLKGNGYADILSNNTIYTRKKLTAIFSRQYCLKKGVYMEKEHVSDNMNVIKKAYDILKKGYAFHNSTLRIQMSNFEGLSEEDYKRIDYKLKAIRQDYAKILVIMNSIDRTYLAYQKNEYIPTYFSSMNNQATDELGCFIEYLFAKYRVILEYIQQILEICIPPRFDKVQASKYSQLKKSYKKYNVLLKYIAENIGDDNNLLNMEWFQSVRVERDFIIHDGATCLVFGDKENLLFKVMTTDSLDKDEDIEQDTFYVNDKGLVYYARYWGLQISKLIIFSEIVFGFLMNDSRMSDEAKWSLEQLQVKNVFVDENGIEVKDSQDVLVDILRSIIESDR